jgi:uncharacterized membrane protein
MNILLWVLQIILGFYFFAIGVMHFVIPPNLPQVMHWMYELPTWLHYVSGIAEILGGLGLILPAVTRIQTRLVALAASGLVLVMIGAMIYHITRGEFANIGMNLLLVLLLAFVAYGRAKLSPHTDRNA